MLYIALDLENITKETFQEYYEESLSIIKQLSNFIKYLKIETNKILQSCN